MTTRSMYRIENTSLITQAIRSAKDEMQQAGRCDGQCRVCPPELLQQCMAHRNSLRLDAESTVAA